MIIHNVLYEHTPYTRHLTLHKPLKKEKKGERRNAYKTEREIKCDEKIKYEFRV